MPKPVLHPDVVWRYQNDVEFYTVVNILTDCMVSGAFTDHDLRQALEVAVARIAILAANGRTVRTREEYDADQRQHHADFLRMIKLVTGDPVDY